MKGVTINSVAVPPQQKNNNRQNIAIAAGATDLGALAGFIRHKRDMGFDLDIVLRQRTLDEFSETRAAIETNKAIINNVDLLNQKNGELKNQFNALCKRTKVLIKKESFRKNLLIGALIGLAVGTVGIFIKYQCGKQKGG